MVDPPFPLSLTAGSGMVHHATSPVESYSISVASADPVQEISEGSGAIKCRSEESTPLRFISTSTNTRRQIRQSDNDNGGPLARRRLRNTTSPQPSHLTHSTKLKEIVNTEESRLHRNRTLPDIPNEPTHSISDSPPVPPKDHDDISRTVNSTNSTGQTPDLICRPTQAPVALLPLSHSSKSPSTSVISSTSTYLTSGGVLECRSSSLTSSRRSSWNSTRCDGGPYPMSSIGTQSNAVDAGSGALSQSDDGYDRRRERERTTSGPDQAEADPDMSVITPIPTMIPVSMGVRNATPSFNVFSTPESSESDEDFSHFVTQTTIPPASMEHVKPSNQEFDTFELSESDDDCSLSILPTSQNLARPKPSLLSMTGSPPPPRTSSLEATINSKPKQMSSLLHSALARANAHLNESDAAPTHHPRRPSTSLSKHSELLTRTSTSTESSSPPSSPSTNQSTSSRAHLQKHFTRSRSKASETFSSSLRKGTDSASIHRRNVSLPLFAPESNASSCTFSSTHPSTVAQGCGSSVMSSTATSVSVEGNMDAESQISIEERSRSIDGNDDKESSLESANALQNATSPKAQPPLPRPRTRTRTRAQRRTSTPFEEYLFYSSDEDDNEYTSAATLLSGSGNKKDTDLYSTTHELIVDCDNDKDISTNVPLRVAIVRLRGLTFDSPMPAKTRRPAAAFT